MDTRREARSGTNTAEQILDAGERLIQTSGYNGFSYAHLSAELGITKASLHYHFRTKADLGGAIITRYHERFEQALARITSEGQPPVEQLRQYAAIYAGVLANQRMCLCGMLAAEQSTLPEPMRIQLQGFFELNERWLGAVLTAGRADGSLAFQGPPRELAALILGAFEGAMLVARAYSDPERFNGPARRLLGGFESAPRA